MDRNAIMAAITAGTSGGAVFGQNGPGATGSMMARFGVSPVNPAAGVAPAPAPAPTNPAFA